MKCQACGETVVYLWDVKAETGIESWCLFCVQNSTQRCVICRQGVDRSSVYDVAKGSAKSTYVCKEDLVQWAARESTPNLSGRPETPYPVDHARVTDLLAVLGREVRS